MEIITPDQINRQRPMLRIIWHNGPYELSWYRAFLEIPMPSATLFPPEVAKVDIIWQAAYVDNGKITGVYDTTQTCFLPCKFADDSVRIALDSPALLDALVANRWTESKKHGPTPKEYPIKLKVSFDGYSAEYNFDVNTGQTPALMCLPQVRDIKGKSEIIIALI